MKWSRVRESDSVAFPAAAALYSLAWLAVMPAWYRYYINPDGVCYISIAQKYLRGEFQDAINGYWGPLYSWLLMPLLAAGVEPLLAARVLGWLLGLGAFAALALLAHHFALSRRARFAVACAALPVVLFFSVYGIMPDLLLSVILVLYVYFAFRLDRPPVVCGLATGALGAAAYLTKSYAMPFFLSHLPLMAGCQFLLSDRDSARRRVLVNALSALLVFALISGTWVALLSGKYGQFTWSTSGPYNLSALAPSSEQNPNAGLAPPPNETAIYHWEDPSYYQTPDWRPYQSFQDLAYYSGKVARNAKDVLLTLLKFSALTGAIVAFAVLLMLDRRTFRSEADRTLYPLATLALFCLGYALIVVESRYLWFCCFLLLVMGGYAYDRTVSGNGFFTPGRRACLLGGFVLSFALMPLFDLISFRNIGRAAYASAQALREYIQPGDRIASDGRMQTSLSIAYHLKARYYGVHEADGDTSDIQANLEHHGIERYLVWDHADAEPPDLPGYRQCPTPGNHIPLVYSRE